MTAPDRPEGQAPDPRALVDDEDRAFLDRAQAGQQMFAARWLRDLPPALQAWGPPWPDR